MKISTKDMCLLMDGIFNIKLSNVTILAYEREGVISKAERGGGGAGGMWTDFPVKALAETFAFQSLIKGKCSNNEFNFVYFDRSAIYMIRKIALKGKTMGEATWEKILLLGAELWINEYNFAMEEIDKYMSREGGIAE